MEFIFSPAVYLTVTQGFKSSHVGNDYGWTSKVAGGNGQPIVAAEAGTVTTAVDGYGNTYPRSRIYGHYVIISHGGGWYFLYGHLLKGLAVKSGQKVAKGQVIGYMGNSGYSMGQHLHFELRRGGNSKAYAVDPLDYLMIENKALIVSDSTLFKGRIKYRQTSIGTPVARDTQKDQLEVKISNLNGRYFASVNADRLGYVTPGYYNIFAEQRGGSYTWYEIEKDLWCASGDGWTEFHKKEEPKLYDVNFMGVSTGDKNTLVKIGDELVLHYSVTDSK